MSTSTILAGQQNYSYKFYQPLIQIRGKALNDMFPTIPEAKIRGDWRLREVAFSGAAAGTLNRCKIPASGGLIGDTWLEIVLGATSGGNYTKNMGTQIVSIVEIKHGGEELHNYYYRDAFEYMSTCWLNERKTEMQLISGGAAAGSAVTTEVPVFAFWCSWQHDRNEFPPPLPLLNAKADLDVEVTLRAIADILASGGSGGSLTSMTLRYVEFYVGDADRTNIENALGGWNRYAYDIQKGPATATVATATSTDIDCSSVKGDIKELLIHTKLVSDVDTNHDHYINKNLTNLELKLDGETKYKFDSSNNRRMHNQLFNTSKVGRDSTNGCADCINFSRAKDAHTWCGAVNSSSYNKLTLSVTHALGANAYVTIVPVRNVLYQFQQGFFKRTT